MATGADSTQRTRASVAAWLGVLFLLVVLLIAIGGYVRLSQSGLSLPGWPMNEGRLVPPFSQAGWIDAYDAYLQDLARLESKRDAGAIGLGAIPAKPADLTSFKRLYLTEYTHRFLAAVVAVLGLACFAVLVRRRHLRELAGRPLLAVVALVVVQSVIGGLLVFFGTTTSLLWVHLGVATVIIGLILWTQLLLLRGHAPPLPAAIQDQRRPLRRLAWWVTVVVFIQLLLGAFVAGSRHHGMSTTWPHFNDRLVPTLWSAEHTLAWNLLDNAGLHQFVHRWFAWVALAGVVVLALVARRLRLGERCTLAIRLCWSTMVAQMVLGVLNVLSGAHSFIALGHLLMAILLICALVVVLVDLHQEQTRVVADTDGGEGAGHHIPASNRLLGGPC